MSKLVSINQSHSVIQALANNVDWSVLDGEVLQEKVIKNQIEAGEQFTAFLKNGGKVIVDNPKVISIDRSSSFDPKSFIGKDWSIDEEDEKSLKLTEIDLRKVILKTTLKDNENYVKGEENLKRLKNGKEILLNARVFQALWENQQLIPEEWKEKINEKRTYVFFDGTILQNSDGCRFVLCLYWNVRKWKWRYGWLEGVWFDNNPSAVLSNSTLNSETLVS